MSLIKAGGFTALILSVLTTAALTAFGDWYTSNTMGETIGHILLWFPISLMVVAPIALILFPLVYVLLGLAGRPSGKLFALIGGILGALIAGYALFRFRGNLAVSPSILFIAIPLLALGATLLGVIGGFLFERMARNAALPRFGGAQPNPIPQEGPRETPAPKPTPDLKPVAMPPEDKGGV